MTRPQPPPRPISGWHIHATCPACGHHLEHIADGRPAPIAARALARCSSCRMTWKAEITLTPAVTDGRRLRAQRGAA